MLRTLFITTIFVPGFVLALRDRFAALLMYLWFGFFRPQDWVWIDISGLRLSLVLGLVLLVPSIFSGLWPNLTHLLSIGNALFLAAALVAQINAADQTVGWYWIDFFVRLTIVCLLSITLITTPRRLIWVMAVISGSLGFHAAKAGLASLLGGGVQFGEGLTGAFTDNNGYALGVVMIIPMLLCVAQNAHLLFDPPWDRLTPWARRGFYAAIPLCAFTVVSTFSRGGFLALATAVLVYIALHRRRVRLSLTMASALIVALSVIPIPKGYFDRLETIRTYEEIGEESAISRTHFWMVAVRMADAHPLGVGLRNFESVYDRFDFSHGRYGTRRAVHSSHFQVIAELGYAGTIIWVTQFAIAGLVMLRLRRAASAPNISADAKNLLLSFSCCMAASTTGFLAGGSFLALALNDVTWLSFALIAAGDRLLPQLLAAREPIVVAEPAATAEPIRPGRPAPTWRPPTKRRPLVEPVLGERTRVDGPHA